MKKHIGLFTFIVGSIIAYLLSTKQEILLNTEKQNSNDVFTASSVSEHLQHKTQSSFKPLNSITENSTSENSTIEAIDPNSGLTKGEIETLVAWCEPRGYRGAPGDYDSMSDETLTALANQNDPKAHMLLAIRLLKGPGQLPSKTLDTAAKHLYEASLLGYTKSLNDLSNLMERRSIHDFKQRKLWLMESYKFAYVGVKRGDPDSKTQLKVLRQSNPLSKEDNQKILNDAESTYLEMAQHREKAGLPPFENGIPENVRIIIDKINDHVTYVDLLKK
ncbi:MAG: hypothetical protein EOO53_09730 [Gammaproteobacteria bacterium]|nr:MAG: hypothetical protein EOO53_09730 [Gammaproteobacteria bacterium]